MHVDWLTVRQSHGCGNAPLFADGQVLEIDCETGERRWSVYKGVQHEGSYSSSLRIRSDGDVVEVSGNPSRWCREENLFGVRSVDAAMDVYNRVLADLGLPEFYDDERAHVRLLQSSDRVTTSGCTLTRVDVTENYSTGGPRNSESALHALRSMRHRNRAPVDYGTTLQWGGKGSRYTSMKYYLKGPEMRAHRGRKSEASEYWDRVASFAESAGVLRFEVCLKAEFLRRNGLNKPGAWSGEVMESIVNQFALHGRAQSSVSSWDGIADQLIELGYSPRRAQTCQEAADSYLAGHNLRERRSTSAFYRLRADLLKVGIDISAPLNVSSLKFSVQCIELRPLSMPEWYRAA